MTKPTPVERQPERARAEELLKRLDYLARCAGADVYGLPRIGVHWERLMDAVLAALSPLPVQETRDEEREQMLNAVEEAWGIIANASGGDWTKERQEWQDAARRWADAYTPMLGGLLQERALRSVRSAPPVQEGERAPSDRTVEREPGEQVIKALNRASEYFRTCWGHYLDTDNREMADLFAEYGEGLDEVAKRLGLEPRAGWPRAPVFTLTPERPA